MARLEGGREGWGAVDHPETGELIQLDESHPKDVAETVASAYDWLEVVSSGDNSGGSSGEDTAVDVCGTEMSDGSICERPADECGYH